jgi:hypothetical protein
MIRLHIISVKKGPHDHSPDRYELARALVGHAWIDDVLGWGNGVYF